MLTRRSMLGLTAAALTSPALTSNARAQDWKEKYPRLILAVVQHQTCATRGEDLYSPFAKYLSSEIGVKVILRTEEDYSAIMSDQHDGDVHIAYYGPMSFAHALLAGVKAEAFAVDINSKGTKGYYSAFYVQANSPYQKIEDLKGKTIGLVDPNSTSGNSMPRLKLDELGINPETYFGKVQFTGSHENAMQALALGKVDVAVNWWNTEDDSNLTHMLDKHMLKNPDGTEMKKEDFRIILKSDLLINPCFAYLSELPDDLKAKIRQAFFDAATKDRDAFAKLSESKNQSWQPVDNKDYEQTIKLVKFAEALKKSRDN